ncbi:MAG: hypothetical protein ABIR50_11180 [Ginsengibacter sp.]
MDLSKANKKVAREVIEKGLELEFANGLKKADEALQKWKYHDLGNKEAYHLLFKTIIDFNEHIAARYDAMTGSKYFTTVADLFTDRIITEADIKDFSPEIIEQLRETKRLLKK